MQTGDREQTGGAPAAPDQPGGRREEHPPPSWQAPAGGYPTPAATPLPPAPMIRRARTGQVMVVAFLAELVITALAGNTAVANHLKNYVQAHTSSFSGRFGYSVLGLSWRFGPLKNDTQHIWLSQIISLLTLFVVTALIVLITVRGPVRFGRTFVSLWTGIVVATAIAGVVRRLVVDGFGQRGVGRFTDAVFSPLSSFDVVLGVALGFIVAVITAGVATATQRVPGEAINPAAAGGPIPRYGAFDTPAEPAGAAPGSSVATPPASAAPEPAGADRTAVLPRHAAEGAPADAPPGAADRTTQLPRTPDERS